MNEKPKLPMLLDPAISGDAILEEGESLQMMHDLMLVKRFMGADTVADGLLHVPEKYREPSCHGTVIAAGPGVRLQSDDGTPRDERVPMEIVEGDTVMYDGSTGINAREYRKGSGIIVVAQRDVLFTARDVEEEELALLAAHDPGGEFYAGPDKDGYWPVGAHLPQWLRDRLEECNNEPVQITVQDKREGW